MLTYTDGYSRAAIIDSFAANCGTSLRRRVFKAAFFMRQVFFDCGHFGSKRNCYMFTLSDHKFGLCIFLPAVYLSLCLTVCTVHRRVI